MLKIGQIKQLTSPELLIYGEFRSCRTMNSRLM
jgi:hypothetical protein